MKINLFKVFSVVMFLALLSKGTGFIRETLVAARYGAGFISDLYVFEDGLVNAIYTVFAGVISTTFVPKYLSLNKERRNKYTSNFFNIILWILIIVAIFLAIFAPILLRGLVPGFYSKYSSDYLYQVEMITRINCISLLLLFVENFYICLLQANSYFIFSAIQGLVLNVSLIVYLFFFYDFGVWGITFTKIGVHIFNIALLLFFINYKRLYKYSFYLSYKDEYIKETFKLAMPVFIVNMVSQLNYIVDRAMASSLDSGSMAILGYANVLSSLLYSVIAVSLNNIAYTDMAEKQKDKAALEEMFRKYFRILINILIPCCIVMVVQADQLCRVVYGRGGINENNLKTMTLVLIIYIPSSYAIGLRDMYNRLLFIYKKTKVTSVINMTGLILNIVLNVCLSKILGIYGLAIATTVVAIGTLLLTRFNTREYFKDKGLYSLSDLIKMILCIGSSILISKFWETDSLLSRCIVIAISGIIALIIYNFAYLREKVMG